MTTPQTPDSMRKAQEKKSPPPKREGDEPRKLSNDDLPDGAKERQGGI